MSKNKNDKKETNFLFRIIVILIIMVIIAFSGFMILFIKYLNTSNNNNVKNISLEYNNNKETKNTKIENKKSFSKEEIKLQDGILIAICNELMDIENSLYELIKMYLNYEISKTELGNSISFIKDNIQDVIDGGSFQSIDSNIYTKAVDEYIFKLNEFILNLDKCINSNDLSYIENASVDIEELSNLKVEIFAKRIEYLKENGFSDNEIHFLE